MIVVYDQQDKDGDPLSAFAKLHGLTLNVVPLAGGMWFVKFIGFSVEGAAPWGKNNALPSPREALKAYANHLSGSILIGTSRITCPVRILVDDESVALVQAVVQANKA